MLNFRGIFVFDGERLNLSLAVARPERMLLLLHGLGGPMSNTEKYSEKPDPPAPEKENPKPIRPPETQPEPTPVEPQLK